MPRTAHIVAAVTAAVLAAAGTAVAQPGMDPEPPPPDGYGPPPAYGPAPGPYYAPPMPPERRGLTLGVGLGLGWMEADSGPIRCDGCDSQPVAGGFDFHIGAMLRPRFAILFEIQGTVQQLDAVGAESLQQIMFLAAAQYWLTDALWLKAGVGSSHLGIAYDDGYGGGSDELDSGLGLLGAVGYEVLHAPNFAIDLSLRLSSGSYEGLSDEISSGVVGLGLSWY